MDPRVANFARLLGAIHEDELRLVKAAGHTLTESYLLQILGLRPGVTVTELARRLSLAKSSVSVVVDTLVRRGLVKRAPRGVDRRTIALSLTAKGQTAVERHHVGQASLLFESVSEFSAKELRLVDDIIRRVGDTLERRHATLYGRLSSSGGAAR